MIESKQSYTKLIVAVAVALSAFALAFMCIASANTAFADETIKYDNDKWSWQVSPSEGQCQYIYFYDEDDWFLEGAKFTNVKSSNKKVAKVKADSTYGCLMIKYGNKTGKAVISWKVNGVAMKHTFKVKYTCPVKKFKVAGKSVLKTFKKKNTIVTKKTLKKKKVVIKTKKNWTITSVSLTKKAKQTYKTFKKKKTSYTCRISTIWPYDGIYVEFKNTKTGETQAITYEKYYDTRYAQAG